MNKKLLLFFVALLIGTSAMHAQPTASIGSTTAYPGDVVTIPLNLNNFTNVGSITLFIGYDPAVLTFVGSSAHAFGGIMVNAMSNPTQVGIVWSSTTPVNINGLLMNLIFSYSGGSSALSFNPGCEISDASLQLINFGTVNGSVTPATGATTSITIGTVMATPGTQILVPVDADGFVDVAAMTLFIAYDVNALSFVGLDNVYPGLAGISSNAMTNPNQIGIVWSSLTPINIASGKLFDLVFVYNGGTVPLLFNTGSEIVDINLTNVPVNYIGGMVYPVATSTMAILGNVLASPGQEVLIPLHVINFNNVAAISFYIQFNPSVMTFVGQANVNPLVSSISSNAFGSTIGVVWSETTPINIAGDLLLDLRFIYHGTSSNLTFLPSSEVADLNLNILAVTYINGSIGQNITSASATIGGVPSLPNQEVLVPVTVTGFTDVGAFTWYVGFNPGVLNFIGLENIHPAIAGVMTNVVNGQLGIVWTYTTVPATILPGKLFDLKFWFSNGSSSIDFLPGCDVSNSVLDPIYFTYYNGGVNVSIGYKVSGTLSYVNSTPLNNSTVYLIASDGITVLNSTTTDVNGYYEFNGVVDGNYYVTASTTKPWAYGYVDIDDALDVYDYWFGGVPNLTGLYWLAADVNNDLTVDIDDVLDIYDTWFFDLNPPTWPAPLWIFEKPGFTVAGSNITINFQGICSGDANGSYVPAP